jgi:hypothetical protein
MMISKNSLLTLLAIFGFAAASQAQLTLPQPSPKASITQTVGLTDITIEYSSPGVKGRKIWGDLVKMDKVWRAGANAPTKITFSKDVMIEDVKVTKGSYAILVTPASNGPWSIHINKDVNTFEDNYKAENNIVTIKAAITPIPHRERLTYFLADFDDNKTNIFLEWEKVRVGFTVLVDTKNQAEESIKATLGSQHRNYRNAARYYLDNKQYDEGLKNIDQALALKSDEWFSHWVKAQLQYGKGMKNEAIVSAQKAKTLGDKNPDNFFFKDDVEKALKEWKGKSSAVDK